MAAPSSLAAAIAELPEADRVVVSALVSAVDQLAETTLRLSEAFAMLNQLDDMRAAAIAELRDELHALQGERVSYPDAGQLAELIAAYTTPAPASLRAVDPEPEPEQPAVHFPTIEHRQQALAEPYHAEIQALRAQREALDGGGEGA